jgi:restriction endonuclease S subunit
MNLNTALINRTEVATPRTEREQKEIVQVFLSMDAEIDALEARLVKARQIKRGMMHNLLTGKIRLI